MTLPALTTDEVLDALLQLIAFDPTGTDPRARIAQNLLAARGTDVVKLAEQVLSEDTKLDQLLRRSRA